MVVENTLAKNITAAGDNAAYDAACKRLLANKVILAWIMKSCLEEYRDFDVDVIAEKYIEGNPQIAKAAVNPDEEAESRGEQVKGAKNEDSTIKEGTVTYDIRFYGIAPQSGEIVSLIINVEAQKDFYPGYPIVKRGIYYCSRMISSQYGVEFTDTQYQKIKKVYSIWICASPPKYRENTINRYVLREENLVGDAVEKRENYDLLTVIMICLGRSGDDKYTGLLKLLDILLSPVKEPEEKKRILQEDFHIRMTKELESEVSELCNLSQGIFEKGEARGEARGEAKIIKSMYEKGFSLEQIAFAADKSIEEVKAIIEGKKPILV